MVDNPFADVGGEITGRIFTSIIWFGLAVIVIGIVGFIMWYFLWYRRQFDIRVMIKSDRSGEQHKIIEDYGAILFDKKNKSKYFRLQKTKVDLPVPPFQVLQQTNKGDLLDLWRKSEDEFIYLTPGTINKKYLIKQDGSSFPVAQKEQKQIEGDISYWNTKRKNENRNLFDTEGLFMKLIPYIPQILGGVITIFVLYVLMDSLPAVLGELTRLTKELQSLKGAEVTTYGAIWSLIH